MMGGASMMVGGAIKVMGGASVMVGGATKVMGGASVMRERAAVMSIRLCYCCNINSSYLQLTV